MSYQERIAPLQPGAVDPRLLDPHLQYCWDMREVLFSRFEQGIRVDDVGLFGVKPEQAALESAAMLQGEVVLDAFCGIGGSAIALARTGKRVITAELDKQRLSMARHNAGIYGVADRILFVNADVRDLLGSVQVDAIYLDPPWGGLDAFDRPTFGLRDFRPAADELLQRATAMAACVGMSVPPNFSFEELEPWQPTTVKPVTFEGELLYYDVIFGPGRNGSGSLNRPL